MTKINKKLFYDPQQLFSYNRLLNFVIGARGIGKTYSMTKYVTNRFLKHGQEEFVYLRRYKTELKKIDKFFAPLVAEGEFPGHSFDVKGKEFLIDEQVAGYALPLSTWIQNKSNSYPNVTTIFMDEFLLERGTLHYLQNEVEAFLNMLDTIIRNRDNVRVVLLSNAVTVTNPYFLYFNLQPNIKKRFNVYDEIVVEIPNSANFAEQRKQTRFGHLIDGTDYGDFSLGNEFTNDSDTFIQKRTKNSLFNFGFAYGGQRYGVWTDYMQGRMFVSNDFDPSGKFYALTTADHSPNLLLMRNWRKESQLSRLAFAFKQGYLRFDNQPIKNACYEIFKHMHV